MITLLLAALAQRISLEKTILKHIREIKEVSSIATQLVCLDKAAPKEATNYNGAQRSRQIWHDGCVLDCRRRPRHSTAMARLSSKYIHTRNKARCMFQDQPGWAVQARRWSGGQDACGFLRLKSGANA